MLRSDRIILVVGSALLLFLLSGWSFRLEPPVIGIAVSALGTAAMFAVLAFGLLMLSPTPRGAVRRRLGLAPGRLAWPVVLLAVAGTVSLSNLLEALIGWLRLSGVGTLGEINADLAGARGLGLCAALTGVALASGTAEELFFRGYLQRGMERRFSGRRGGPVAALLLASTAFALAHFDKVHSPAAFVLGLYLGGITWLADGLWPSILCHVVNNALAVFDSAYALNLPVSGPWLLVLEALVVVASLLAAARWRRPAPSGALMHRQEAATAGPSIDRT